MKYSRSYLLSFLSSAKFLVSVPKQLRGCDLWLFRRLQSLLWYDFQCPWAPNGPGVFFTVRLLWTSRLLIINSLQTNIPYFIACSILFVRKLRQICELHMGRIFACWTMLNAKFSIWSWVNSRILEIHRGEAYFSERLAAREFPRDKDSSPTAIPSVCERN